jgi:23S rRNA pseudouridine1911/1915/1917 synthase
MDEPYVLEETESYVVVHKPPKMHSAPLEKDGPYGDTLLDWCGRLIPALLLPRGRKPGEGGIVHRLDYETQGLVLFAKTQAALEAFYLQQERGNFVKEYGALSVGSGPVLPGFPPPPEHSLKPPLVIASGFRPYGPGRKAVRPLAPGREPKDGAFDGGEPYRTRVEEILEGDSTYFRLSILRGFRHQIRCHLAWIAHPILGDSLYGGADPGPGRPMALSAQGLCFLDPLSLRPRRYGLEPLCRRYDGGPG